MSSLSLLVNLTCPYYKNPLISLKAKRVESACTYKAQSSMLEHSVSVDHNITKVVMNTLFHKLTGGIFGREE